MHIDRNTGIIEMFMEKLQDEDEGTYTFQIQDGKATGHSTLVLIGDGKDTGGQSAGHLATVEVSRDKRPWRPSWFKM